MEAGILLNGESLNNIRYADDTVKFADNLTDLQHFIDQIVKLSDSYDLRINKIKTKLMIIIKGQKTNCHITISGNKIERINKYRYLGIIINEEWDLSQEIK